jgi:hypothetical protein
MRILRIGITVVALAFAAAHLRWPDLSIDAVTLALLLAAISPWLGLIFKSLELPGGWKLEYREFQAAAQKAQAAGLLSPKLARGGGGPGYLFQQVSDQDPNLAMAGLRLEIERRLLSLAEARNVKVRRSGIRGLTEALVSRRALSDDEASALNDLTGLLNSAVHGARVSPWALNWALEIGPPLLAVLEEKLSARGR